MKHGKIKPIRRFDQGDICGGSFSSAQVLKEVIPHLENIRTSGNREVALTDVATGFALLDRLTGGLHLGELVVVADRPNSHMAAERLVHQIVLYVAGEFQIPVAYFSTKKSRELVLRNMALHNAGMPWYGLNHGVSDQEWLNFTSAAERIANAPIIINDASADPRVIREEVSLLSESWRREPFGLIVVDRIPDEPDLSTAIGRTLGNTSAELFRIARDNGAPVIALASVSPRIERRKHKMPRLADIISADGIEWYADTVLTLSREEMAHEPGSKEKVRTDVSVLKSFYGSGGRFDLFQEGPDGLFSDHWR